MSTFSSHTKHQSKIYLNLLVPRLLPKMSELGNTPSTTHQVSLVLHTAVDFGHNQGVGIGIIQSATTGAAQSSTLPTEEQSHSFECGQARAKNLKTRERAHMFALILAMGLARSTIKRKCTTARVNVQNITVFCSLPAVFELIKHHHTHGPMSLESVVSVEDRLMIKRVLASAKRLLRYNVQVSIVEDGAEGNIVEAARAKVMAHKGKKKPCRRRRHERRIMAKNAGMAGDEDDDGAGDEQEDEVEYVDESRNNSSQSEPMIEIEASNISVMHETGEPESH